MTRPVVDFTEAQAEVLKFALTNRLHRVDPANDSAKEACEQLVKLGLFNRKHDGRFTGYVFAKRSREIIRAFKEEYSRCSI